MTDERPDLEAIEACPECGRAGGLRRLWCSCGWESPDSAAWIDHLTCVLNSIANTLGHRGDVPGDWRTLIGDVQRLEAERDTARRELAERNAALDAANTLIGETADEAKRLQDELAESRAREGRLRGLLDHVRTCSACPSCKAEIDAALAPGSESEET